MGEGRPPGAGPPGDLPAAHVQLVGTWRKASDSECARAYPDEIQFFEHRYLARRGPGQSFVRWDIGGYEVTGPGDVRLGTATDERIGYRFSVAGDDLTFVDDDGCEFTYQRAGTASPEEP